MRSQTRDILCYLGLAYMIFVLLVAVVAIRIPAEYHYNNAIGNYIEFAKQQSTFDGMRQGVLVIKEKTNILFPDKGVYNSGFYWDFVYKNTITAQEVCYNQIIDRINTLEATYNRAALDTRDPTLLKDWYAEARQNILYEMNSNGLGIYNCSLSYVVSQAYMVKYEPLSYWLAFYIIGFWAVGIITIICLSCMNTRKSDEEYRIRKRSQND